MAPPRCPVKETVILKFYAGASYSYRKNVNAIGISEGFNVLGLLPALISLYE